MIFYWFLSFLVLKMIRSSSENIVTNKIHILDQLPPITEKSAVLRQFSWLFEVRSIVHFGLASFYYFIRSANSNLPNITWSYSSQNSHWRSHTVILVITNHLITRTYLEPKTFTIIILSNRYMWYIEKATYKLRHYEQGLIVWTDFRLYKLPKLHLHIFTCRPSCTGG